MIQKNISKVVKSSEEISKTSDRGNLKNRWQNSLNKIKLNNQIKLNPATCYLISSGGDVKAIKP